MTINYFDENNRRIKHQLNVTCKQQVVKFLGKELANKSFATTDIDVFQSLPAFILIGFIFLLLLSSGLNFLCLVYVIFVFIGAYFIDIKNQKKVDFYNNSKIN